MPSSSSTLIQNQYLMPKTIYSGYCLLINVSSIISKIDSVQYIIIVPT